jgi:hypothetical protein
MRINCNQSLHKQKSSGMKAPMATNTGSMIDESSIEYGSGVRGPLGRRFFADFLSSTSSRYSSGSGSLGIGGSLGTSVTYTNIQSNEVNVLWDKYK